MQPRTEPSLIRLPTWSRWLSYLLLALFIAGTATLAGSATVQPGQTTYRVVPVSPAQDILNVHVNAAGQLAFTEYVGGVFRARFFDGHSVRDIGTLGGPSAWAYGLNDLGQVAGSASIDAAGILTRAYRWSARTGMLDLGRLVPGQSIGTDINSKGQVTGGAVFTPGQGRRGFLWTPETRSVVNIGTLDLDAYGTALNDAGAITGLTGGDSIRVFRWTRREGMRAITNIYNEFTTANDINAAGHIVGAAALTPNGSVPAHAFVWTPREGLIDLGASFSNRTIAERINDRDMVIGNVRDFTDFPHGFVWSRESGVIEIGAGLPRTVTATADLNNRGQVVGGFDDYAFVWTRAQGVVNLNTLLRDAPEGLKLTAGRAISENGAIAASGNTGLVLLVPTPPSGNEAPVVGPVSVTGTPRVQALLSFTAAFRDADPGDSHRATWAWGDGASATATVSERSGRGNVSGQHAYRSPGTYTVKLTVTDSSGRSTTVHRRVVVQGPVPPVQR
jgi:probable HAF family extracellular repeat protein